MINWVQGKLCLLKDSWLQYFHLCSASMTVRCQRNIWYQRWGGQASPGLLKCFLHLLLLQFIVSETVILLAVRFSWRKDECECCFLQPPVHHSAISPASSFHFSFSSTCFGCIMRGQSVSSVVSILGSRWRLPGSSYSTNHQTSPCWLDALGFISPQTKKQEIPLQMPLSKHPRVLTWIGSVILSICILARSICVFTVASWRQRKSKSLDLRKPSLSAPGLLDRSCRRLGSPTLCTSFPQKQ